MQAATANAKVERARLGGAGGGPGSPPATFPGMQGLSGRLRSRNNAQESFHLLQATHYMAASPTTWRENQTPSSGRHMTCQSRSDHH